MALVGVICGHDGSYQSFDTCIACHELGDSVRKCHAPVFVLKDARDNAFRRAAAGISVSTILGCAREHAIMQMYDYYETPISMYNKARGTWTHAMFESDPNPPEWVLKERRLFKYVDILGEQFRISGQFDEFDTKRGLLVDYKSKDNLPKKIDPKHEAQFNCYAWLLSGGTFLDTNEPAQYETKMIAAHYVTWKTKAEKAWLKMAYPVWDTAHTEALIIERSTPIVQWRQTKELPTCNCFDPSPYWKCGCVKLEEQLAERGIVVG